MASLQGRAEVLSVNTYHPAPAPRNGPQISLAAQDASSNLRAVHSLFAAPNAPVEEERAQKRRKLDNGNVASIQQAGFDENRSIVLGKISLDLVSLHLKHQRFLD